jgi:hypothetical protein
LRDDRRGGEGQTEEREGEPSAAHASFNSFRVDLLPE